ncbi:MAG: hypothetical protein IJC73_07120 [Lentisphaeria bacterium]|nr:hypothetical protein [Lentisphaeria bacterium]
MKKIFFWVMLMTVALAVTAEENLYRMAPADTAGTLRLQTGALLAQPLLKDLAARSGEVDKAVQQMEKLSTEQSGLKDAGIKQVLYTFSDQQRWCVFMECTGVTESLFRSTLLREYPNAQEVTIAGRTAYVLKQQDVSLGGRKLRGMDDLAVAVMLFRENLIVAGAVSELAGILNGPTLDPVKADQLNRIEGLIVLDVLDCSPLNRLFVQEPGTQLFRSVRGIGTIEGSQAKMQAELQCSGEAEAQEVAGQLQQTAMFAIPMSLSADPELAQQIMKRLKISADKDKVCAEVVFTREMLTAAAEYKNKSRELRQKRREMRKRARAAEKTTAL